MGLDKFSTALDLLTGFNVNLYVGEEVFNGKLIGVEADHVVLETENQYIFYYNIDKIQAITKNTRQFKPEKTTAKFQKTQSLTELLHSFQHSWVTMLCINKQSFSGVLSEIDTDFATLINGEERILIKLTHISNILKGFIKEEVTKPEATKELTKAKGDSETNKSDSSNKADLTTQTSANKTTDINNQSKNETPELHQEKSENKEMTAPLVDIVEPNNTMVWSEPIKTENTITQTKDEIIADTQEYKKIQVEEVPAVKAVTELKNTINETPAKVKKAEEPKVTKSKPVESQKEMKPVKETASIVKTENKPAPPLQLQKKEGKSSKSQETTTAAKPVTTQNQVAKKTETTITDEPSTKSVWKQKDQETKAFRFSGEPVPRENQRAFPFAGWPNRNNRTLRF
ncbi:hypothetical protein [Neobacillus soli]|uniref:hypothetical protein n=1 Tax=Neobacillus soli TaxID=220688 RepID=UPI0008246888|nr:hypothetical protein [Neobacillus soli]